MSTIDWTMPLRTKDSHLPVRVLCTDFKFSMPDCETYTYVVAVLKGDMDMIVHVNPLGVSLAGGTSIENIPVETVEYVLYNRKGYENRAARFSCCVATKINPINYQELKLTSVDGKLTKVEILP